MKRDRTKRCVECNNVLLEDGTCACGAPQPTQKARSDGLCAFRLEDRRCPLAGTHRAAKGAPWYCFIHDKPENRIMPKAAEIMGWIEGNPEGVAQIFVKRYPPPFQDSMIDEMVKGNPEWQRQTGESFGEYVRRVGAVARPKIVEE